MYVPTAVACDGLEQRVGLQHLCVMLKLFDPCKRLGFLYNICLHRKWHHQAERKDPDLNIKKVSEALDRNCGSRPRTGSISSGRLGHVSPISDLGAHNFAECSGVACPGPWWKLSAFRSCMDDTLVAVGTNGSTCSGSTMGSTAPQPETSTSLSALQRQEAAANAATRRSEEARQRLQRDQRTEYA